MIKLVFLLACLPALALSQIQGTEGLRPCPGSPAPFSVDISDCVKAPCELRRGTDMIVNTLFENPRRTSELTARTFFLEIATGIRGEFPFDSATKHACDHLSVGECPLLQGEDVIWVLEMPILRIYPTGVPLDLTMILQDDNGQNSTCFQVEAITTN